jgi:hypothetical protein
VKINLKKVTGRAKKPRSGMFDAGDSGKNSYKTERMEPERTHPWLT